MLFTEYRPSDGLADYIDAYWVRRTDHQVNDSGRRVYADGCADIIVNTGESAVYFNPMAHVGQSIPLYPGRMYLGGTMTAYGVVSSAATSALTGIRFRPGGIHALYKRPMVAAVDRVIAFREKKLQLLMEKEEGMAAGLDAYFSTKKISGSHDFAAIYNVVYHSKGQVSVEDLSGNCHVSIRTMERVFKKNVGISPKEFIRIVRFQEVLKRLRQAGVSRESLLRIAFELGYYDHAHLTNEFKKYAGILPSELSHFYKTGIARGQYF
jgi:AraC-like DNA-binding protein